jgi:regulator of sigma E protease
MGPALWKKQGKETLYSIRLLPIGGYNALEGEDGDSEDKRAFCNKPWWARIIILVSGAAMNVVIAYLALTLMLGILGFVTMQLDQVVDGSPAAEAGLKSGDTIVAIDGKDVEEPEEVAEAIEAGKPLTITVERDGHRQDFAVTPEKQKDGYKIGIVWGRERSVLKSLWWGVIATKNLGGMMVDAFRQLLTGGVKAEDVAGPVGMVTLVHQTESQGITSFLMLVALISWNLAILNLLPFPALDGGRIIFVIIRQITGEAITDRQEAMVHGAGMMLLLMLVILVTWNDIGRLIAG